MQASSLLTLPRNRGLVLPQPTVPLTLSGNEITPYMRRFGKEGDGLNPNDPLGKYSIGIEEATQNKVTQSIPGASATTNVTKAGDAAATLTLVADPDRPFSNAAATVWELDNSAGSTDATVDFAGNTGNTNKHSVSVYAKKSAGTPTLSLEGAGGVNITQTVWSRSKSENLTPGGTTENLRVTAPAGAVVRFTAAQLEEQPIALSFVMSNGSAASRSAAYPYISSTIIKRFINENTSWVAMCWKMPWPSSPLATSAARFFWWGVNDDRISLQPTTTTVAIISDTTTNRSADQAGTFVANEEITVIGAWVPATVYVSLNGAAPTTGARNSEIPDIGENFYIGSGGGAASEIDANLLFMAMGKGTLSSANYAAIHNIARNNRIDSRIEDLPGGCTFKWPPADGDVTRGLAA